MASAQLSRRVEKVVGYPPLSELSDLQRREFHEALLEASAFEDLPGKWQAAILKGEQNRPKAAAHQQRLVLALVRRLEEMIDDRTSRLDDPPIDPHRYVLAHGVQIPAHLQPPPFTL